VEVTVSHASRTLRQGLIVGLIAYAAVALFYSAFDFLAARGTLFTVDMLGKAVFRGLRDPAVLQFPVPLDWGAIIRYDALHLALSLCIGVFVTWLVDGADRHPERAMPILAAVAAGGVITVLVVGNLTEAMRPVLPWWSIVVANVLAALLAGAYLLFMRPGLRPRLASVPREPGAGR
jgi:hypothetical protein